MIQVIVKEDVTVLQANTTRFSTEDARACLKVVTERKGRFSLYIVDLTKIDLVDSATLKELALVSAAVQKSGARLMVLTQRLLSEVIVRAGLESQLPCYVGVMGGLEDKPVVPDGEVGAAEIIEVLFQNACELIETYTLDQNPRIERELVEPALPSLFDIAGVGSFQIDGRKGTFVLGFQTPSYLKLISQITKKTHGQIDSQNRDWAAEFINTLLVKAQSKFRKDGHVIDTSFPTLLIGQSFDSLFTDGGGMDLVTLKCDADFGVFFMKLALAR